MPDSRRLRLASPGEPLAVAAVPRRSLRPGSGGPLAAVLGIFAAGGRGAVTLLVTHRFSTVAAADLVVVLDQGRVVEHGPHRELVAAGGHYAELYELQARGYR